MYAAVPVKSELPRGSNVQYARSSRCPFLCKFNVIRKTASRRHRLKDAHHPAVIIFYDLIFYNLYYLLSLLSFTMVSRTAEFWARGSFRRQH